LNVAFSGVGLLILELLRFKRAIVLFAHKEHKIFYVHTEDYLMEKILVTNWT